MAVKRELILVTFLTTSGFVIGVVPWILLLFKETKNSVHWLVEISFQYWGWFLVFCLTGYAFKKTLKLKNVSKISKITIGVVSLVILGWSLLWALLVIAGLAISTIV
jgi:hypothetical protein